MRYLFYHYTEGLLILHYSDDDGLRFHWRYMGYTLREAIRKFRQENNLRYKHITVEKLY